MDSTAAQRVRDYASFGEGRAYILMTIARRAHNPELTNSTEIVRRRVLYKEEHVERHVAELLFMANKDDYEHRMYLSVNARDVVKALFNFRSELESITRHLYHGDEGAMKRLTRLDSEWLSQLHRPQAKADEYFQFDLDDVEPHDRLEFIESLPSDVTDTYWTETPNGYHVITEPFNYTEWEPPIEYDELDTDGQLHIAQID